MENFSYTVSFEEDQMRLVSFLKKRIKTDLSNKKIKKALEKGICRINSVMECFASRRLQKNDKVEILKDFEKVLEKKQLNFQILFEDDYYLIVDKPKGFICEFENLQKYFPNTLFANRLDKNTTGVLILTKKEEYKEKIASIFSKREVKKRYFAIVDGNFRKKTGKIECYLKRKKGENINFISSKNGKYSLTHYKLIKNFKNYAFLECFPETGRTHQIRVHMKMIKHPILGDYQYQIDFRCKKFVPRTMLHSYSISFIHPYTDKNIFIKSEIPDDFKDFLK